MDLAQYNQSLTGHYNSQTFVMLQILHCFEYRITPCENYKLRFLAKRKLIKNISSILTMNSQCKKDNILKFGRWTSTSPSLGSWENLFLPIFFFTVFFLKVRFGLLFLVSLFYFLSWYHGGGLQRPLTVMHSLVNPDIWALWSPWESQSPHHPHSPSPSHSLLYYSH